MGNLFAGTSVLAPIEFFGISGLVIFCLIFITKKVGKKFGAGKDVVDQIFFQRGVVAIVRVGGKEVLVTTQNLRASLLPETFSSKMMEHQATDGSESVPSAEEDSKTLAETRQCLEDILRIDQN